MKSSKHFSVSLLTIYEDFTLHDQNNYLISFSTNSNDAKFSFIGQMGTGMISPRQRCFEIAAFDWLWNPVFSPKGIRLRANVKFTLVIKLFDVDIYLLFASKRICRREFIIEYITTSSHRCRI